MLKHSPPAVARGDWVQITSFPDSVSQPALSPDGRMVTFVRGPNTFLGPGQVYVKMLPSGDPVQLRGARVSARYFEIFGIQAERGRTFRPDEDQRGKDRVVILSHVLWVNQFGADPSIVDRTILLDNEPHTVVGVLPAGSAFDRAFNQLWRPLAFEPSNMTRNFHWLVSFARLKHGVSLRQAQAGMTAIGARIERDFPDSNKGWGVIVERYADTLWEVLQSATRSPSGGLPPRT